jgi:hypothetical protein
MALRKFWLNAFIASDVPGYTKVIPTGKHMNKTAIPLLWIARFWPGNTFKGLDACDLTDQRGFSDSITASSRMHCEITVEIGTFKMVGQSHWSSGTTESTSRLATRQASRKLTCRDANTWTSALGRPSGATAVRPR